MQKPKRRLRRRIDPILQEAIDLAGGRARLANLIGCSRQNVWKWYRIPAEQVLAVERAVGLTREALRPDLFNQPRPKRRSA